jgi:hypothetical protein
MELCCFDILCSSVVAVGTCAIVLPALMLKLCDLPTRHYQNTACILLNGISQVILVVKVEFLLLRVEWKF